MLSLALNACQCWHKAFKYTNANWQNLAKALQMNSMAVHTHHALLRPWRAKIPQSSGGQYSKRLLKLCCPDSWERPNRGTNQVRQLCAVSATTFETPARSLMYPCVCVLLCAGLTTFHHLQLHLSLPPIKPSKMFHEIHLQHVGARHLLEQEFSALPLWRKAGNGPHFDLDASVELLVPHVPNSLDWCGYCFVLQIVTRAASSVPVTWRHKMTLFQ